jgi:probable HAF family extracellular repeat protein
MRRCVFFSLALGLFLTAALAASADLAYTLVDLGGLAGGSYYSALGVNNLGQVTGDFYNGSNYSTFLYSGGTMTDLGAAAGYTVSGTTNTGESINDSGQIAGTVSNASASGLMYYDGTTMHNLGAVGGETGTASGSGINNSGQIAGYYTNKSGTQTGFLYSGGLSGTTTELGTHPGGTFSMGSALNNSGEVAGGADTSGGETHAITWTSSGGMVDLGSLIGSSGFSIGLAINSSGEVAGNSDTANTATTGQPDAFLYNGSTMVDLGTLGGVASGANGINDSGNVVGWAYTTGDASQDAFLDSGGTMYDLDNLVTGGTDGWTLESANAISNTGYIVGYMEDASGDYDGFLLDPTSGPPAVPEPGTLSLVGFGLLGLIGYRRRKR